MSYIRVNIYIRSKKEFEELREEIRDYWYKSYGEHLSNTNMVTKSLLFFRDFLKGELRSKNNDNTGQDLHQCSRIRFKDN